MADAIMRSLVQQAQSGVDGREKRCRRHGESSKLIDGTEDSLNNELEHIQHRRSVCTDVHRCWDLVAKLRECEREAVTYPTGGTDLVKARLDRTTHRSEAK